MAGIDEIIHQPVRLRIMAALNALDPGEQIDFTPLRDMLKLTDGNLGGHLAKLETAAYIKIEKVFIDRKPRTFISLTGAGRDAFVKYLADLKQILKV
jgi:DNA-binding MarR family transcriptional regulator